MHALVGHHDEPANGRCRPSILPHLFIPCQYPPQDDPGEVRSKSHRVVTQPPSRTADRYSEIGLTLHNLRNLVWLYKSIKTGVSVHKRGAWTCCIAQATRRRSLELYRQLFQDDRLTPVLGAIKGYYMYNHKGRDCERVLHFLAVSIFCVTKMVLFR